LWESCARYEHRCQHHDIQADAERPRADHRVGELRTREQAVAAGATPKRWAATRWWPDCVLEWRRARLVGGTHRLDGTFGDHLGARRRRRQAQLRRRRGAIRNAST
jgi:hypothetical protein